MDRVLSLHRTLITIKPELGDVAITLHPSPRSPDWHLSVVRCVEGASRRRMCQLLESFAPRESLLAHEISGPSKVDPRERGCRRRPHFGAKGACPILVTIRDKIISVGCGSVQFCLKLMFCKQHSTAHLRTEPKPSGRFDSLHPLHLTYSLILTSTE